MEHYLWLLVGLGSTVLCAATWGVCHWWYGRQLAAAASRLDKVDRARLFAGHQAMQARKQIERMQRDMALLQQRPVASAAPPTRAAQVEAVLRSVDSIPARQPLPAHGFADTEALQAFV